MFEELYVKELYAKNVCDQIVCVCDEAVSVWYGRMCVCV